MPCRIFRFLHLCSYTTGETKHIFFATAYICSRVCILRVDLLPDGTVKCVIVKDLAIDAVWDLQGSAAASGSGLARFTEIVQNTDDGVEIDIICGRISMDEDGVWNIEVARRVRDGGRKIMYSMGFQDVLAW